MIDALVPVKWTTFWDMHSGGGLKEPHALIFIEAPIEAAEVVFYNRFGHSPYRVTCDCCGEDYSVDESDTLQQASGYHRGCGHDKDGYAEVRDTSGDRFILEYAAKMGDPRLRKLVALAKDKGATPNEREVAIRKILATPNPSLWHPIPEPGFVPFEEFEQTGRTIRHGTALIIRAADIRPEEYAGYCPKEREYEW